MSDKKIIWVAVVIAIALLTFYAICFIGSDISKNTSDWGAFGNYVAICVSTLSIALI